MRLGDEELMAMTASGSEEAFDMLYERYRHRIFRFAVVGLNDHGEAEDLVQEVFIRVLKAARDYKPQGRFRSWLFQIAANRIRTRTARLRDQAARVMRLQPVDGPGGGPPHGLDEEHQVIARDLVRSSLNRLPQSQRTVLILKEMEGMDCETIAQTLEMSCENVRVQLHRARRKMLGYLRPQPEASS